MDISYPCDADVIEAVLPHRAPFRWVDRVIACDPGASIHAELYVRPDLPLFAGHFPAHPVLPGVIVMEALAQAASFCALVRRADADALGFLTGIDDARFRRQVRPGDVLTLRARVVKSSSRLVVAEVEASVDGELCASATQKYVLAKGEGREGAAPSGAEGEANDAPSAGTTVADTAPPGVGSAPVTPWSRAATGVGAVPSSAASASAPAPAVLRPEGRAR